jgi:hypothetical protein
LAGETEVLAENLCEWKQDVGVAYESIMPGLKSYGYRMQFHIYLPKGMKYLFQEIHCINREPVTCVKSVLLL